MTTKNFLTATIILLIATIILSSCKKEDVQNNGSPCFLVTIKNAGDTILQSNTYNSENRPVKIQYYFNNLPNDYAMYYYTSESFSYCFFSKDGKQISGYENLLPFNSQGLTTFAYYVRYSEANTRYDSIFYEYNAAGYKTKETRWLKIVSKTTGEITLGMIVNAYTYVNNYCTKTETIWDEGLIHYAYTYDYEYYLDKPNRSYNITPWLGKLNAYNIKKITYTSFNRNTNTTTSTTITDYMYEYDGEGRITKNTFTSTTTQNGQVILHDTQVYKYFYECI